MASIYGNQMTITSADNGKVKYTGIMESFNGVQALWEKSSPTGPGGTIAVGADGQLVGTLDIGAGERLLPTKVAMSYAHVKPEGIPEGGSLTLYFRSGSYDELTPEPGPGPVYLIYSGDSLEVNGGGAVAGSVTVTAVRDTFTDPLTGVTFTGLPSGLTGVATRLSGSTATITFTGTATGLTPGQSVSVGVSFGDAAFTGGSAAAVTGSTRALTLTMSDAPAKAKTLLFYGDSITTMGYHAQASINPAACSVADGIATIVCTGRHGLIDGDAVRICGLNTEISKTFRVTAADIIDEYSYKVPSGGITSIVQTAAGTPGSMRVEALTSGYGNYANWLTGNKAEVLGAVACWGSLVSDFVARFQNDVLGFTPRPDYVHILGGTNDMSYRRPVAEVIADYQTMRDAAAGAGIKCIWGCIPARRNIQEIDPAAQVLSLELVAATKAFAESHGDPYVDYMAPTLNPETGYMYDEMNWLPETTDRLHFSPYGNWVMGHALAPVIDELFSSDNQMPTTAAECGIAENPLFAEKSSINTTAVTGEYPTGTSIYVSTSASTKVTSAVEAGPYGNIWKMAVTDIGPSGYGALFRLVGSAGLTHTMSEAGWAQIMFKLKVSNVSDIENLDIYLNWQPMRDSVTPAFGYANSVNFVQNFKASDFEIDIMVAPFFLQAGETLFIDQSRLSLTAINRSTDSALMSADIEMSQFAVRINESGYFPTR